MKWLARSSTQRPAPTLSRNWSYDNNGNPYDGPSGCMIDGQQVPCSMMMQVLRFGTGVGRDGGSVQFLARDVSWRTWSDGPAFGVGVIRIPRDQIDDPPQNSDFDMPGISKLVDLKLNESDCLKFAQTILNQLSGGKGGNLTDVFNAFLDQPKAHDLFTRVRPVGSRGEATALGKLKDSTATMYLRTSSVDQTLVDADNVIQELFHFAGKGYNDRQLAEALRKTPYAEEASGPFPDGTANIFDERYIPAGWSKDDGYSTYFHAIAARHCGLRQPNVYRNTKK